MLASISLGILLVRSDTFHLHDSIFLLQILSKNEKSTTSKSKAAENNENLAEEKPICNFDQFKLILLSLFGLRLQ